MIYFAKIKQLLNYLTIICSFYICAYSCLIKTRVYRESFYSITKNFSFNGHSNNYKQKADKQHKQEIIVYLSISDMKCKKCLSNIYKVLQQVDPLASIDFNAKVASLSLNPIICENIIKNINLSLSVIGNYKVFRINKFYYKFINIWKNIQLFSPLIGVLTFILIVSLSQQLQSFDKFNYDQAMRQFMGIFFITFSVLKLLNLKGFSDSFCKYDIIANKIRKYGFIYPFIEMFLGVSYLYNYKYFSKIMINIITIILMSISTIGVNNALRSGEPINCACIGTLFSLPMTKITLFENIIMVLMAIMTIFMPIQ